MANRGTGTLTEVRFLADRHMLASDRNICI